MSQFGVAIEGGAIKTLPTIAKPVRADSNLIFILSPGVYVVLPYYTTNPQPCQLFIKDKNKTKWGVDIKSYNSTNISYSLGINIPGEQQSSSKHMQGEQVHLSQAQQIPIWGISVISIFPPMI